MSISWNRRLVYLALVTLVVCACEPPATETREYAPRRNGPKRARRPLANDTGEDIRVVVDGAGVTDWTAEIAKRERALDGSSTTADPAHAEMYGFPSRTESAAGL